MELSITSTRRQDADASSAQTFAEVVVSLSFEPQAQSFHSKCTKRLPSRTLELDVDSPVRQSCFTIFLGNNA